jgi:hypothetical protein
MGLTKGLRFIQGVRRQLDEDDRNRVAEAIREHLALDGWRIEPGRASAVIANCQAQPSANRR